MFAVEFLYWEKSEYAKIKILFLADCFARGPKSFALGPVDWNNYVLLKNCSKTTKRGDEYYYYTEVVKAGDLKTVSVGLDLDAKIYLTGEQMVGSAYFSPKTDNFAFKVSYSGGIIPNP
jgi:hypothetical protein